MRVIRSAGRSAWAIVGIVFVGVVTAALLIMLKPLVIGVLAAICVSTALAPAVDALARRGLRRGLGTGMTVLLLIAAALAVPWPVIRGLNSQWSEIAAALSVAVLRLHDWLASAGLPGSLAESASASLREHRSILLSGVGPSVGVLIGVLATGFLTGFVFLFSTFFLLKDGPSIARAAGSLAPWGSAWLAQVGGIIRGYVLGLTSLAVIGTAVIGVGAVVLDVRLVPTIVIITMLGNYIPYLGAWVAGAYAVLIALASGGSRTALLMAAIIIIANSVIQTLLQPFAYGRALRTHPLTIMLAIVAGGLLAGILGIMVAAPVAAVAQLSFRMLREHQQGVAPLETGGNLT